MNANEEPRKKNLTLGDLSIERKKDFRNIYSTLLFSIKPSSKSTFVQSSNLQI